MILVCDMAVCGIGRGERLASQYTILHVYNPRSPTHRSVPRHIRAFATRHDQLPQLLLTDSTVVGLEAAQLRRLLLLVLVLMLRGLHMLRQRGAHGRVVLVVSKVRVTRWARNSQDERTPVRVHPRAPRRRALRTQVSASCLHQPSAGLTDVTGI